MYELLHTLNFLVTQLLVLTQRGQKCTLRKTIQLLKATYNLHTVRENDDQNFSDIPTKTIWNYFISHWNTTIRDQSTEKKLGFYEKTKPTFTRNQYLKMPDFRDRQRLTKLLCSDHALEIERGRHSDTSREKRVCTTCQLGKVEDEEHFLMECPAYAALRTSILGQTYNQNIRPEDLIQTVPPTTLTKYIKAALELREHRHSVTHISLCGTRITITQNEPTKKHPPRVVTNLQAEILTPSCLRIRISRKRKHEETQASM